MTEKKYTVTHTVKVKFYYDVDAESEEDAIDKVSAIGELEWNGAEKVFADDYELASSRWDAEEAKE